jgi:uncharacterized delta-60 repeat protein
VHFKPLFILLIFVSLTFVACTDANSTPPVIPDPTPLRVMGGVATLEDSTRNGTAIFLRARHAGGTVLEGDVLVRIEGPDGWNGGVPLEVRYSGNSIYSWVVRSSIAPVTGSYLAMTLIDGVPETSSFQIDAARRLEPIRNLQVSGAINPTNQFWVSAAVRASFSLPAGVLTSVARVSDLTSGDLLSNSRLPPGVSNVNEKEVRINPLHGHAFTVLGLTANLEGQDPPVPNRFDVAIKSARLSLPFGLDPSYGINGWAAPVQGANALLALADNSVLLGGSRKGDLAVTKLKPDGQPDLTFGVSGTFTTNFALSFGIGSGYTRTDNVVRRLVAQGNRKFLVLASSEAGGSSQTVMTRLTASGQLDSSFGTQGKLIISGPYDTSRLWSGLAVQPDGGFVVGGYCLNSTQLNMCIARFGVDGQPDTAFGTGGRINAPIDNAGDVVQDLAVQPDGKVIAVGGSGGRSANGAFNYAQFIARFTAEGQRDPSFATGGINRLLLSQSGGDFDRVALLPNGKILVAGGLGQKESYLKDYGLARFNSDGSLDLSFGTNGSTMLDSGNQYDSVYAMAVLPNGQVLLAGTTGYAKFEASGAPIAAVSLTWQSSQLNVSALAVAPDGAVFVGRFDPLAAVARMSSP